MKLFAQMGYANGEKSLKGLKEGNIDGVVIGAKDIDKTKINQTIKQFTDSNSKSEIYLDPQFYTSLYGDNPLLKLGKIVDWDYFKHYQKSSLESEKTIEIVLNSFFKEIKSLEIPLTGIITPNIYISESFDSREAVISKNFIRASKRIALQNEENRPIFASLVICRDTLLDQAEFEVFLNDITQLETPPDGFYVLVGSKDSEAQNDIFYTDVISNWMLINHALSINGYKVINGYSDIISPFLLVVGGYAGATGWWENLRSFSINRFFPTSGGRLPNIRYLSLKLLNRVSVDEYHAISDIFKDFSNRLMHDDDYLPAPDRSEEVLQSWEALKFFIQECSSLVLNDGLGKLEESVKKAVTWYEKIYETGLQLDKKSQNRHLDALNEAIQQFRKKAQL